METEELIEWLKAVRSSKYCWDEYDKKVVNEIIKRLEKYDKVPTHEMVKIMQSLGQI